ncbi:MAG TPA: TylF/MycF/NovP-related O-methyltransferase, partial [Vicinamibacterales bacterium]
MNVPATLPAVHSRDAAIRRVGKRFVAWAGRHLPPSTFDAFLRFARAVYRGGARSAYAMRRSMWRVTDRERYDMACAIADVLPFTLVGIGGLEATYEAARRMNRESRRGAFVELGVARGGCAAMLGKLAFEDAGLQRTLWLFDSFEGLPDPTVDDFDAARGQGTGGHVTPLGRGSCLGMLEDVEWLLFERCRLKRDRVTLVKGWFQDTLPEHARRIGPIALLRIDGDWYESTKVCLEHLYDHVVAGGVIIVDDYESCFGCTKAVDEFLAA